MYLSVSKSYIASCAEDWHVSVDISISSFCTYSTLVMWLELIISLCCAIICHCYMRNFNCLQPQVWYECNRTTSSLFLVKGVRTVYFY
jgi:hypothetical protein